MPAEYLEACDCFGAAGCWQIKCDDCGTLAHVYDDEEGWDYVVHWSARDEALDDCGAGGFEHWDDDPEQPTLCSPCMDQRLAPASRDSLAPNGEETV